MRFHVSLIVPHLYNLVCSFEVLHSFPKKDIDDILVGRCELAYYIRLKLRTELTEHSHDGH